MSEDSHNNKTEEQQRIFPNGPTVDEVENWKEKYGAVEMLPIAGTNFIYRQLTRAEHRTMTESGYFDSGDPDEITVKALLLFPKYESVDWDMVGGGVIPTLAQSMMRLSGFVSETPPMKL